MKAENGIILDKAVLEARIKKCKSWLTGIHEDDDRVYQTEIDVLEWLLERETRQLITAENYAEVRAGVSDEFIEFVRENMPSQYEYFREKEETFQELIELLRTFR